MVDIKREKLREWTQMAEDYGRLERELENEEMLNRNLRAAGKSLQSELEAVKAENNGLKRDLLAIRKITSYKGKSVDELLKGGE